MKRLTLEADDENNEYMNFTDKSNPEYESLNRELKLQLELNIGKLPEKYRVIFIMREVEKLNVTETARILDISESNVKARLSRAKDQLRNSLMEIYPMGEVYQFNLVRCDKIVENVLSRIA